MHLNLCFKGVPRFQTAKGVLDRKEHEEALYLIDEVGSQASL